MYHEADEKRDYPWPFPLFFPSTSFSLRRLFKPSAGRRLARPDSTWTRLCAKENVKISSRPAHLYTPSAIRDVCPSSTKTAYALSTLNPIKHCPPVYPRNFQSFFANFYHHRYRREISELSRGLVTEEQGETSGKFASRYTLFGVSPGTSENQAEKRCDLNSI